MSSIGSNTLNPPQSPSSERVDLLSDSADLVAQLEAIHRSQAVIEFEMDGTIVTANENFLNTVGYSLQEVQGRHHRMFVRPEEAASPEYRMFWEKLNQGEFHSGEYKRIGKGGREIWIQASYNPMLSPHGKPYRIAKFACEITEEKLRSTYAAGQLKALDRSQAIIEFEMDGTIVSANENFLNTVGYSLQEVQGRHHRMFVTPEEAASSEYRMFWEKLNRGEYDSGEYKRIGKGGREVWIQASYNPIFDPDGKPCRVVKFAVDVGARRKLLVEVADVAAELIKAAEELTSISSEMQTNAQTGSTQAKAASETAEMVSGNVQTVAASVEEMDASIREITKNAQSARQVATDAVELVAATNTTVGRLGTSSGDIGKVVKLIRSIAQQTNLLSLNATIEAARAGEAGRGFAVVANEVKELARETAKATEEISQKIEAIQTDTQDSVEAISRITEVIGQVNEISTSIASAVEEQSLTTAEIGRSAGEAARGTSEIAHSSLRVAKGNETTQRGADQSLNAADELVRMAESLQELVRMFES